MKTHEQRERRYGEHHSQQSQHGELPARDAQRSFLHQQQGCQQYGGKRIAIKQHGIGVYSRPIQRQSAEGIHSVTYGGNDAAKGSFSISRSWIDNFNRPQKYEIIRPFGKDSAYKSTSEKGTRCGNSSGKIKISAGFRIFVPLFPITLRNRPVPSERSGTIRFYGKCLSGPNTYRNEKVTSDLSADRRLECRPAKYIRSATTGSSRSATKTAATTPVVSRCRTLGTSMHWPGRLRICERPPTISANSTYRRTWAGKRLFLKFYGVESVAHLFVNGTYVGEHRGGTTAFVFEITDRVKYGSENLLRVAVSNAITGDVLPPRPSTNLRRHQPGGRTHRHRPHRCIASVSGLVGES